MALTLKLDCSTFVKLFDEYDRSADFSILGREALYNFLSELSEDSDSDIKIDVIALCCAYSEYDDNELFEAYGHMLDADLADLDDLLEEIESRTTIIRVDNGNVIIEDF